MHFLIAGAKVALYFYSPNFLLKIFQNFGILLKTTEHTYIYYIREGVILRERVKQKA